LTQADLLRMVQRCNGTTVQREERKQGMVKRIASSLRSSQWPWT